MDPVVIIVIISVLGPVLGSAIGVLKKPSFGYILDRLSKFSKLQLRLTGTVIWTKVKK